MLDHLTAYQPKLSPATVGHQSPSKEETDSQKLINGTTDSQQLNQPQLTADFVEPPGQPSVLQQLTPGTGVLQQLTSATTNQQRTNVLLVQKLASAPPPPKPHQELDNSQGKEISLGNATHVDL